MAFLSHTATFDQIKHCKELLEHHSVAKRGVFDGDYYQQLFGLIAQTIVADLAGCERPSQCHDGPDPGYDVTINGVRLDVKCVIREYAPKATWACNLTDTQARYQCDGYIFMSYDKSCGVFHIVGWDSKHDFLMAAKHNKVGDQVCRDNGTTFTVRGTGFFEKPIRSLQKLRTLEDLRAIKVKA